MILPDMGRGIMRSMVEKKFKLSPVAIVLLLIGSQALAANWVYVSNDIHGTLIYYDPDTVAEYEDQLWHHQYSQAWFLFDHSEDSSETAATSKQLFAFKCGSREGFLKHYISYDTDGQVMLSERKTRPDFQSIAPDTIGSDMLNSVCRSQ